MATLVCRSAFISDVHLGLRDCKAGYLLDFLRRLRCEQLYLVGDIIDLEALARKPWWHPLHSAVLAELFVHVVRGTRVTYIPGNHDAALRMLAGRSVAGIEVALDAVHVGGDGRRYRVSHGDEYDPDGQGRAWTRFGNFMQNLVCSANRHFNALRGVFGLPYLPLSLVLKAQSARALAYIRAFESRVATGTRTAGCDGAICGHIHFGHVRILDGVLYLNDGDWVEHCTALIEHADGAMELLHWSERPAALGRASRERVLPSPAAVRAFAPLGRHADARPALRPAA